jgi:hypothetical protein
MEETLLCTLNKCIFAVAIAHRHQTPDSSAFEKELTSVTLQTVARVLSSD